MPQLIIGSVPRKDDYFGREELIESLWKKLKQNNILLIAPRRFGKTGAMYKLYDDPREPFKPHYMTVEHIMSASDFMVELIAGLMKNRYFQKLLESVWTGFKGIGKFARNLPSGIELGQLKVTLRERTPVPKEWKAYGEKVIGLLEKEKTQLLLLIDEFPIMVSHIAKRNMQEIEEFLRWFRSVRIAPDSKTRLVIGGSTNLVTTLDSINLVDSINDLYLLKLEPFDQKTASSFIEAVFKTHGIPLKPKAKDKILELLGAPIPYLLSVLLSAIFDRLHTTNGEVTTKMVEAAFEEDLLGGATSAVFQHYRSRIDQYYTKDEAGAAKVILRTLSRSDNGVSQDTIFLIFLQSRSLQPGNQADDEFRQLMDKLENDFYIVKKNGKYEFFSRVLKLWWKNHYGFQGE